MSNHIIAYTQVNVLNASYQELGPTQLKRALALVASNRAVIEEGDESRRIRSVGGIDIPFPLVIRLLEFVRVPYVTRDVIFSKRGVLERDKYKCGYCNKAATTHDHIFPKSRGGGDTWMNAIAACSPCNNKKNDRTPEEARMPLLFQPHIPVKVYIQSDKPRRRRKNK